MIVTPYGLIRWDNGLPDTGHPALPNAYWWDRDRCGYTPVMVPGEGMSFYTQSWEGVGGTQPFADLRLALINSEGEILNDNVAPLLKHDVPGGSYNIYATFVVPSPVPDGLYRLRIYSVVTAQPFLTSNYLRVMNSGYENQSVYVRYRHDRSFFGTRWHDLPGFYGRVRLMMNLSDEQTETEREIYKEMATGRRRNYLGSVDKVVKLEVYYADSDAHDAIAMLMEHEFVEINGREYKMKGSYRRSFDVRSKVYKGEMELYDEIFAGWNRCI